MSVCRCCKRQVSAVANWPARQNHAVDRAWRSLLQTAVVERRKSEVLMCYQLSLPDDGPVYHALSVHRSRAKLITRSTIDMPWRNFLSPEFGAKFQREVPLFLKAPINFLTIECRTGRRKLPCNKTSAICPSISIENRPVTDRQTDTGP